jgi:hypothetical protein
MSALRTDFRSDRLVKGPRLDLAQCRFVRSTQVQDLGISTMPRRLAFATT